MSRRRSEFNEVIRWQQAANFSQKVSFDPSIGRSDDRLKSESEFIDSTKNLSKSHQMDSNQSPADRLKSAIRTDGQHKVNLARNCCNLASCKQNGDICTKCPPSCHSHDQHPFDRANIFGKVLFSWVFPFIWNSWRIGLRSGHEIPKTPSESELCHPVGDRIVTSWKREIEACNWRLNGLNADRKSSIGNRYYRQRRPSLIKAVIRTHYQWLIANSFLAIFAEVFCKSLSAYSVGQMLYYMNSQQLEVVNFAKQNEATQDKIAGLLSPVDPLTFWTLVLISASFSWVLAAHYYGFQMLRTGLQLRVGCSHLIYQKSLKLGQSQSNQATLGKMINLLSNDLDKFNYVCIMIPFLWVGPMQTLVSMCLLWPQLGPSCLGSLLILAILTPIQFFLRRQFAHFRRKIAACTDERVRLLNESISSIKMIKLYGWELPFKARLVESRSRETELINRVAIVKGFSAALMYVSSKMVLFVTIIFHCLIFEQQLDSRTLFVSMAMLNNVQFTMTQLMPRVVSLGSEALVSLNRISDFLLQREFSPSSKLWAVDWSQITAARGLSRQKLVERQKSFNVTSQQRELFCNKDQLMRFNDASEKSKSIDCSAFMPKEDKVVRLEPGKWVDRLTQLKRMPFIHCQNVGAQWPSSQTPATLEGLNFRCQAPELVLICGQIASGKSSLFMALLNELPISQGIAQISGRLSYASQAPWIFNGTIRDNITFFSDHGHQVIDELRYKRLIDACALTRDLELFKHGDLTYVQADSLSGGQKARINLARCLYRECDIYLLDDPLRALDARVAAHVFQRAIVEFLADKLVLLATNQVGSLLNDCDKLLVLDQGTQMAFGTSDELIALLEAPIGEHFTRQQHDSMELLGKTLRHHRATQMGDQLNISSKESMIKSQVQTDRKQKQAIGVSQSVSKHQIVGTNESLDRPEDEDINTRRPASWSIWSEYYRENSPIRLIIMLLAFLLTQTLFSTVDVYLTIWSMVEQNRAQLLEIKSTNQNCLESFRHQSLINNKDMHNISEVMIVDNSTIGYDFQRQQQLNSNNNEGTNDQHLPRNDSAASNGLSNQLFDHLKSIQIHENKTILSNQSTQFDDQLTTEQDTNYILIESQASPNVRSIYRPLYALVNDFDSSQHVAIYTILLTILFVFSSVTNILSLMNSNNSARSLYRKLLDNALFAKMSFYDRNPIGRFLNRATRDFGIIDEALPYNANQAYDALLQTLATFILITLIDFKLAPPSMAILFVVIIFYSIQVKPNKDIQRLEGVARSPLLGHIASTLNGLHTIRAAKAERQLERQFATYQDAHSSVFLLKIGCNRYTAIVLDLFNACYIAIVALTACLAFHSSTNSGHQVNGPAAGLAITSAILLAGLTQHGVMKLTETESLMTSVERVLEYCRLPLEEGHRLDCGSRRKRQRDAKIDQPFRQPPPSWPSHGKIEFRNIDLYYSHNSRGIESKKPVLKNLSFEIEPSEKVGIIGRTGAGKSSLVSALFRLHPAEGTILIDGLDIKTLQLNHLRCALGIIPQDPILFASATIRQNLDPFGEYPDDLSIWSALDKVSLRETIRSLPGQLDFRLDDNDKASFSFSSGQMQLICLARVLLRKNRIIVLDEATANVDPSTETIIQSTIKSHFKHCTVLTITHRVETILDCNRIMILEAGQIVDFDTPERLLNKGENSYFSKLLVSRNFQ